MDNPSSSEPKQTTLFEVQDELIASGDRTSDEVAASPERKKKRGRPKKNGERPFLLVAPEQAKARLSLFEVGASSDENSSLILRFLGDQPSVAAEMEVWVEEIVVSTGNQSENQQPEDKPNHRRLEIEWPPGTDERITETLAIAVAYSRENQQPQWRGPDRLSFPIPGGLKVSEAIDATPAQPFDLATWHAGPLFSPVPDGIACRIDDSIFRFRAHRYVERVYTTENEQGSASPETASQVNATVHFLPLDLNQVHEWLRERNTQPEFQKLEHEAIEEEAEGLEQKSDEAFNYHTGQEWTAFLHTATDGKRLRYFVGNIQAGTLRHQRPNAAFWTETALTEDERRAGHGIELLQNAASELDLDDALAWLYISHLIAPQSPLAKGSYAGGWIDLDDVARKTMGGYARNPAEALQRRRKIWHAIRYGTRTQIIGARTVPYFDKTTGQEIDTKMATSPWQIIKEQKPVQASLLPDDDVPVRVELVASREWTALTTSPDTAQFLPAGELLGAIPPSQASGAWARALGMAYFHWCRCHLMDALEGRSLPTRDALLNQFPNKKINHIEVLYSPNPRRAMQYWAGAEALLIEVGIIEATPSTREPTTRQGWQKEWLKNAPEWKPGPKLRPLLEALAQNLMPKRPIALQAPRRKRGRPRKNPVE